ncbi:MAG TPA: NHL repeat-containing protein [Gaiellales bacterium]|nr:NHL repeat-containing protein [Gaiellales bacterium]
MLRSIFGRHGWRLRTSLAMAVLAVAAGLAPSGASAATLVKTIGFPGPAGLYAYGMDWDASDNTILVGDYWNYRVKRYTTSGTYIGTVSKPDPLGTGSGIGAPYDVEADMIGNPAAAPLWVADQGNSRIVEFTHNGTFMRSIGRNGHGTGGHNYSPGCGGGHMTIPTHIFADPISGNLYVSDPRCRQVYIFKDSTGDYVGQLNWSGSGVGTPIPRGVDGDGNGVYVVEFNTRAIYQFNRAGQFIKKFASNSAMNDPRGMDIGGGNMFVVSAMKNTVYEYSASTGAFERSWSHTGGGTSGPSFDSIRFPAVDGQGNVYVGDTWGCPAYNGPACSGKDPGYRVYKYSSTGAPLALNGGACNWSLAGTCSMGSTQPPPKGGFNQQNGIGINPADNSLFVVDTFEQRVQKFDTASTCTSATSCPAWILQFAGRAGAGVDSEGVGYPRALVFGSDGRVWLGDNNNDVQAWTPGGSSTASPPAFVHRFGSQGTAPGQFKGGVQGLTVTAGRVYATDYAGCRLQVFDENTLLKVSTGTSALEALVGDTGCNTMHGPRGVAVDPANPSVAYVTDGARLLRWNLNLGSPGHPGGGTMTVISSCGLSGAWGVTFHNGAYYIGDVGHKRIMKYVPGGSCTAVVSGLPQGSNFVAFDNAGRMYASDNSKKILVYSGVG